MTPSEIMKAYKYGADFVKIFPVGSLGAAYVKAVCAPINHIRLLAVGGVNEKNIEEFLAAGAVGAGVGGERLGIYFVEKGASQRASKVIYDRANSAVALSKAEEYDWDKIFEGADWFHWTGSHRLWAASFPRSAWRPAKQLRSVG